MGRENAESQLSAPGALEGRGDERADFLGEDLGHKMEVLDNTCIFITKHTFYIQYI